jgi:hypothetical protein
MFEEPRSHSLPLLLPHPAIRPRPCPTACWNVELWQNRGLALRLLYAELWRAYVCMCASICVCVKLYRHWAVSHDTITYIHTHITCIHTQTTYTCLDGALSLSLSLSLSQSLSLNLSLIPEHIHTLLSIGIPEQLNSLHLALQRVRA